MQRIMLIVESSLSRLALRVNPRWMIEFEDITTLTGRP